MKDEIQKYLEAQEKWLKETGVTIGSKVLVVSEASNYQGGWQNVWPLSVESGQIVTVDRVVAEVGIAVRFQGHKLSLPFFVLVKLEE